MMIDEAFWQLDFPAIMAASFAAAACALVGSLLVLRRESLAGDALSHLVLPGIVVAWVVTGSLAAWAMLGGALAAALLGTSLLAALGRHRLIGPEAATGIVFTTMFAAGVVMLSQWVGRRVHLDVDHALYGNLEGVVWPDLTSLAGLLNIDVLAQAPRQLPMLASAIVVVAALLWMLRKEIVLASFDPENAALLGVPPGRIDRLVALLTATVVVASFESVGAILVVALLICPAATARLLTDRYGRQLLLATAIGLADCWIGYLIAVAGPPILGYDLALGAAGTIAFVSGLMLGIVLLVQRAMVSPGRGSAGPEGWTRAGT
ncbi:MAG TPA: metal ABC transporter permease [Geminicoccus sp.]|jgi:manganese/zinc/iron transport system permease protein|uniref:metal ABC transporter permease n=1 Tax=Geminicoccus sp. TaxID=2024832 RepID=UPI002E376B67|nr:metal ABC transporter permease [Geminicoccus sp.]HEX2529270.1 metal ABC transporter permease [Geminicoccus sp.]